ncbi:MAG: MlaD family protein [Pseudomonadota bacterium]
METRANYALIGAFVLLATAAVVSFVLWLGSSQFNRDYQIYDIVFPGPVVLEEGASVRYIGITVGEVESVRINRNDPSQVRARIRVDRSTPVKADSTAIIDFAGITGVTFVQITAGSDESGPLLPAPYQDVPVIAAGPTPLAALFDGGAEIVGKASITIDQLAKVLTEENIQAFSGTLSSVETITGALAEQDSELLTQTITTLQSLERAGTSLTTASDSVSQTSDQLRDEIATLNVELQSLIAELNAATGEAQRTINESRKAIEAAGALLTGPGSEALTDTGLAAQELRILMQRLDRVVREMEANPQGLVLGRPLPYEE